MHHVDFFVVRSMAAGGFNTALHGIALPFHVIIRPSVLGNCEHADFVPVSPSLPGYDYLAEPPPSAACVLLEQLQQFAVSRYHDVQNPRYFMTAAA